MIKYNNLDYSDDFTICYGPSNNNIDKIIFHENTKVIADLAFTSCKKFKTIKFPTNLEVIGSFAFQNTCLEELITPPFLNKIGKGAFSLCENLITASLKQSDKITFLDEQTFNSCVSLSSIDFPKNIKEIKYGCFSHCNFESISFPESMEQLCREAFDCCKNLKITDLTNIKQIGSNCFSYCTNLEEVKLLKGSFLGDCAFNNCANLKHIDMPKKLHIFGNPFCNCKSIVLYIDSSERKEYEHIFKNEPEISLKEKDIEYYINTGKSFKEINKFYKNEKDLEK